MYLIEVTAYFTAVKFRINIAHDFLRETLKEIPRCWTSDTCQLCLSVGGALNFREWAQLKSRVAFSKKQFCTVRASQNYLWQSPVHGLFSLRPCRAAVGAAQLKVPAGDGTSPSRADVSNIRSCTRHTLAAIPLLHHQLVFISPF